MKTQTSHGMPAQPEPAQVSKDTCAGKPRPYLFHEEASRTIPGQSRK